MRLFTALTTLALGLISGTESAYASECNDCMGTSTLRADLGPRLSPNATISLKCDNATLFDDITHRYTTTHPDLFAFISVGTGEDVGAIIRYALDTGYQILAGNRRHGWSLALNRIKGAIMIDVSPLVDISIDTVGNTVTVGGGVNIAGVTTALQAAGKETPTGICDCVGFLGATLGGGHGRLQGRHGLMIDNLLSAELTISTGETITVSNTSNPELFWGLRGAGQNFGIVTEATYKIYDAANGGKQFVADAVYDFQDLAEVFGALNNYDVPAEHNALAIFIVDPVLQKPVIWLNFVSSAPDASARAEFDSVFGHITHLSRVEAVLPWAEVNAAGLSKPACASRTRKVVSGVSTKHWDIPSLKIVSEKYKELVAFPATVGTIILFESYSVKGVQAVPAESTAYPWREETGVVALNVVYQNATTDAAAEDWIYEIMAIMHADSGFERPAVYMNYAKGTEGFGAIYGYESWRQEKLKSLKKEWDPSCMFSGYNPIPIDCQA